MWEWETSITDIKKNSYIRSGANRRLLISTYALDYSLTPYTPWGAWVDIHVVNNSNVTVTIKVSVCDRMHYACLLVVYGEKCAVFLHRHAVYVYSLVLNVHDFLAELRQWCGQRSSSLFYWLMEDKLYSIIKMCKQKSIFKCTVGVQWNKMFTIGMR